MPKASVCLITYNHVHTVAEALDSIVTQRATFPFEVVVGDDCSTDGTQVVLERYAARYQGLFKLRLAPVNAGVVTNLLGAFNACRGRYVALLEGDDFWSMPDKLQLQVDAMEANPTASLCGTNAFVKDERDPSRSHVHPLFGSAFLANMEAILVSNFFSTCTMMVRKDGPLEIPSALLPVWGDWAMKLHYARKGDTLFLPQQTGTYRITGTGAWSSLTPVQRESEVLRVLKAFQQEVGPGLDPVLVPRIRHQLASLATAFARESNPIVSLGAKYHCPVCSSDINCFQPLSEFYFNNAKQHGYRYTFEQSETLNYNDYSCPLCNASDRDRLYALYVRDYLAKATTNRVNRIVDFAPSAPFSIFIRSMIALSGQNVSYITADLSMEGVDDRADIADMRLYDDNQFDFFICSHILEHVSDDRKALNELYRILKPRGLGILMVPIVLGLADIDEDPSVKDESERWRRFGQYDHVRLYSKDGFIKRTEEAGFIIHQYGKEFFGEELFEQNGITDQSILYIVEK